MTVITKFALEDGISVYTLVVYRHILGAIVMLPFAFFFERKARATPSILLKIVVLGIVAPILDQDLFYLGFKYTSATFSTNMANLLPAVTFILAWIWRLERVKLREMRSRAKVAGTLVSMAGATVMTLYKGPSVASPLLTIVHHGTETVSGRHDFIKGTIILLVAISGWASFFILQTITLQEFPAELMLTMLICVAGSVPATAVALVMERGNHAAWALGWNIKLLTVIYRAIISTGMTYFIQGAVTIDKGPVFVTAFSPLETIIITIAGIICLGKAYI